MKVVSGYQSDMFDNFFKSFGPTLECRLIVDKITRTSLSHQANPGGLVLLLTKAEMWLLMC